MTSKILYNVFSEDGSLAPAYREVFDAVSLKDHPYLLPVRTDKRTTRRFHKKGIDENVINAMADWLLKEFRKNAQ
ncbi:hypothetical protein J4414_00580 [Candidatus Woesearchaeota archaeon]|nr:hypothetical protein [Candidatus Woesearchaeota archaeon]